MKEPVYVLTGEIEYSSKVLGGFAHSEMPGAFAAEEHADNAVLGVFASQELAMDCAAKMAHVQTLCWSNSMPHEIIIGSSDTDTYTIWPCFDGVRTKP